MTFDDFILDDDFDDSGIIIVGLKSFMIFDDSHHFGVDGDAMERIDRNRRIIYAIKP